MLGASAAPAHAPESDAAPGLAQAFSIDPWLLLPWAASLLLYLLGLRRLWRRGRRSGVGALQAISFLCGWLTLGLATLWPLDALGTWSLAAHMGQHMLLMALAPPLLLAGLPGPVWLSALPAGAARRIGAALHAPALRGAWRWSSGLAIASALQAAAMWGWHAPAAMQAALQSDPVHYAMHASFLITGLLFWSAVLRSLRAPAAGVAAALAALIATMLQMGLLSALLVFAERPLYPWYLERALQLGLSALEDQQLAGLIMWVPAAVPYLLGGLILAAAWLVRGERHSLAAAPPRD
jgi:putative membrane protein